MLQKTVWRRLWYHSSSCKEFQHNKIMRPNLSHSLLFLSGSIWWERRTCTTDFTYVSFQEAEMVVDIHSSACPKMVIIKDWEYWSDSICVCWVLKDLLEALQCWYTAAKCMSESSVLSVRMETHSYIGSAFNTIKKIIRENLLDGDLNTRMKRYWWSCTDCCK